MVFHSTLGLSLTKSAVPCTTSSNTRFLRQVWRRSKFALVTDWLLRLHNTMDVKAQAGFWRDLSSRRLQYLHKEEDAMLLSLQHGSMSAMLQRRIPCRVRFSPLFAASV